MTIIKSAFYCSIQDLGRKDYRYLGVPHSGVMDEVSARFANQCLNNDKNDAVLEIIGVGGTYIFSKRTFICISGAITNVRLNSEPINQNIRIKIEIGDTLEIAAAVDGNFIYVAIAGGFKVEEVLNSRSQFK